jgi:hypothetical protein
MQKHVSQLLYLSFCFVQCLRTYNHTHPHPRRPPIKMVFDHKTIESMHTISVAGIIEITEAVLLESTEGYVATNPEKNKLVTTDKFLVELRGSIMELKSFLIQPDVVRFLQTYHGYKDIDDIVHSFHLLMFDVIGYVMKYLLAKQEIHISNCLRVTEFLVDYMVLLFKKRNHIYRLTTAEYKKSQ